MHNSTLYELVLKQYIYTGFIELVLYDYVTCNRIL